MTPPRATLTALLAAVCIACSTAAPTPEAPARDGLRPVSLPDLSGAELSVANQIRDRHAALGARLRAAPDDTETGDAYGALGLVLRAAGYDEAAEPALLNARTLDPGDVRWPYYLEYLYRSRGDLASAEAAFDGARVPRPDDPAMLESLDQELAMVLDDGPSNERRGVRALERQDWAAAASAFRRGAEVTLESSAQRRSLLHKLGTALYFGGDVPAAVEAFEQVVAAAPASGPDESTADAHYDLGAIVLAEGRLQRAITHFEGAVRYRPDDQNARLVLAETLWRAGRAEEALPHFERVLEADPGMEQAAFQYSMALIEAGRYRDARARLENAMARYPDRPEFAHMLARLLVSAPDASVRDGTRAMRLMRTLLQGSTAAEMGETLAMVRAELGDFSGAVEVQRDVIAAARKSGAADVVPQMERNLRLYESGQPVRSFLDQPALASNPEPRTRTLNSEP